MINKSKQETLEEAVNKYTEFLPNLPYKLAIKQAFKEGAKWQQENIIEELEMHILVNEHDWSRNPQAQFRDFVEQFKRNNGK